MSTCWLSPSFRYAVIGDSLAGSSAAPVIAQSIGGTVPLDAVKLLCRQLEMLSRWSAAPDGIRRAAERCSGSFAGSIDIMQMATQATSNPESSINFVTHLVARLKSLTSGQALLIARPEMDAATGVTLFVVHRCSSAVPGSDFAVAVCASDTDANMQYFPSRIVSSPRARCHVKHPLCYPLLSTKLSPRALDPRLRIL